MKKIHRFIGAYPIAAGRHTITQEGFVNQARNVLKLRPGEHIVLCDGRGTEAQGEIVAVTSRFVEVAMDAPRANTAEPPFETVLALAILKSENFEVACQKATEAGVSRIVPLQSERTVKKDIRLERLEKIVREAAEQSGRGAVPRIHEAISFEQALGQSFDASARIFFDAEEEKFSPGDLATAGSGPAWLFIGPEGGWSPSEKEAALSAGLKVRGLGSRVLRAETAATVAVFNAVFWREGF